VLPAAAAVGNVAYDLAGSKRGLIRENLARPMGLPPEDRRVGRAARRAFRNYAKYLVDMMRIGG
jgi:lauroyl/myristoyl acyltransferase